MWKSKIKPKFGPHHSFFSDGGSMAAKKFLSIEESEGKRQLRLHSESLDSLLSGDVGNKPVIVLSVAGPYRTGKTFLLNSIHRWFTAPDKSTWLENKSECFQWRSGCDAHTNGMYMSEPIPVTLQSGEEALLLIMDSPGIFDDNSSTNDSTKLLALSTILSSMQIYNVMNNLKSDDLDNLQLFAEYGRMAMDSAEVKPFQDLMFLIRDWYHTQNHPIGSRGGDELVAKRMSSDRPNLAEKRQQLKACFTDVGGYLLPHPGDFVAGDPKFTGDAKDMKPMFITALENFMSTLQQRLCVKMNGTCQMTCAELGKFIEVVTNRLGDDELPDAKSVQEAYREGCNEAAVNGAFSAFLEEMELLLDEKTPALDGKLLAQKYQEARENTLKMFAARKLVGDPTKTKEKYSLSLEKKMDEWYERARKFNEKHAKDMKQAAARNIILVQECIKKLELRKPSSWLPRWRSTIEKECAEVDQEILEIFQKKKVTCGWYTGEESELRLRDAMERSLREALASNTTVWNCWIAGAACIVVAGVACGAPVLEALSGIGTAVKDTIIVIITETGKVIVKVLRGLKTEAIADALSDYAVAVIAWEAIKVLDNVCSESKLV